ncbi:uncharacterized protein LOC122374736 [Amphibalanus amphitrite]|uniref:uncharacterized protein LOC122374736 n=1 Tax=Amphibalanus amphitrite TaxID=1232801 RepID=UPI001C91C1F5|nr:uncharacterized protein LOC122374736 [Amphibalanus amphitrite]
MLVQVRHQTARKVKDDEMLAMSPCFIAISGSHNHETTSAASLKELRVLPSVEAAFHDYFRGGMGPAAASRHHQLKLDLAADVWVERARADTNPTARAVIHIHNKWLKSTVGGWNDSDMFAALENFANNTDNVVEVEVGANGSFCVALVTPLMARVHELREAGEVVFVDATASVDRLNTAVIPLLCATPMGALPLGIVLTSSQDEAHLTKGFELLKKALGEKAFYGRQHPECFMTDNCDAERGALRKVWPESAQYLCIFHVLQQVWRWVLDSRHGVPKQDRQRYMAIMKQLVYAPSPDAFQLILDGVDVAHEGFARLVHSHSTVHFEYFAYTIIK